MNFIIVFSLSFLKRLREVIYIEKITLDEDKLELGEVIYIEKQTQFGPVSDKLKT